MRTWSGQPKKGIQRLRSEIQRFKNIFSISSKSPHGPRSIFTVYSSKSSILEECIWSFFRFWEYRFLKSVLSFSKPQLNFQKIKMSRILLPLRLNFGCSSHMCTQVLEKNMEKNHKNPWKSPTLPFRLPGLPGQVDRLLTAAGSRGSLAQGPQKWRFPPWRCYQQKWMDDPILGLGNGWMKLYEMINYVFLFLSPIQKFDGIIDFLKTTMDHGNYLVYTQVD